MAEIIISALPTLSASDFDRNVDYFIVEDTSAGVTKKILPKNIRNINTVKNLSSLETPPDFIGQIGRYPVLPGAIEDPVDPDPEIAYFIGVAYRTDGSSWKAIISSGTISAGTTVTNPSIAEYIPLLDSEVAGKYYPSINECAAYLSSGATASNQKVVKITTTQNSAGTTIYANLCDGGLLYDYVNYQGAGFNCKVVFDYAGGSGGTLGDTSKIMKFKDLELYFGTAIANDRIISNCEFNNCKLYFYRNTTLTNCKLDNSYVLADTGVTVNLLGGLTRNLISNKNVPDDGNTQVLGSGTPDYVESLPTDPTL